MTSWEYENTQKLMTNREQVYLNTTWYEVEKSSTNKIDITLKNTRRNKKIVIKITWKCKTIVVTQESCLNN